MKGATAFGSDRRPSGKKGRYYDRMTRQIRECDKVNWVYPTNLCIKLSGEAPKVKVKIDGKKKTLFAKPPHFEFDLKFGGKPDICDLWGDKAPLTDVTQYTLNIPDSRPHIREYALFGSDLIVFVRLPDHGICSLVEKALKNIRYLGCKDSQVWCRGVQKKVAESEVLKEHAVTRLSGEQAGTVVLLADSVPNVTLALEDLIPGNRKKEYYQHPPPPHVLPGYIKTRGQARLFLSERL